MSDAGKNLINELQALVPNFKEELDQAGSAEALEELRVKFLGRKGQLAELLANLRDLSAEDRPEAGKKGNAVKNELNQLFAARELALAQEKEDKALANFDPAMPGRTPESGSLHPISLVMDEICSVLGGLGFEVVSGPEVETDFYNFEALNLPPEHPARDMQDTLYVTDKVLLRTHTSPMQVRSMLKRKPPVAVIAPGKVYRRDSDITHTPMFHQIEGLYVDKNVSMADLRGTLTSFVQQIFGKDTKVRFRPSFFPFTEPSAEVDISCVMCGGKGEVNGEPCRVCKQTGWVEILGCGMVDPQVFKSVGYDSEEYTGFAFGLGIERVAMLKYGIGDLRMFFENDSRFLRQFC
ncbi:phenylalanine--tRNA ligase subunit alpha [Desulfobaculum bizertense]|uniref:Phenylalanine--tRNA ligase alpha subunit n=1 Tax=Desulfobaculum bizertense DSM 18034 TaxID=1121442 RepID=A0A1T4WAT5_9BACT|nr:phenylalanine--tRNA ligase subunit alpha [Desulfobaculum bizertense]UIJ37540.1 phenylalanine--tRNA ligase subunit alpha [Desulfobaculum bizertense]SKA74402.1 phenylalanyl-tRNA synthetase, alpha subunit [Desulfobaculum bizertense DSM 18034]